MEGHEPRHGNLQEGEFSAVSGGSHSAGSLRLEKKQGPDCEGLGKVV